MDNKPDKTKKKRSCIIKIICFLFIAAGTFSYIRYLIFWDVIEDRDYHEYITCQRRLFDVKSELDLFLNDNRNLKFDKKHNDPYEDGFCERYFKDPIYMISEDLTRKSNESCKVYLERVVEDKCSLYSIPPSFSLNILNNNQYEMAADTSISADIDIELKTNNFRSCKICVTEKTTEISRDCSSAVAGGVFCRLGFKSQKADFMNFYRECKRYGKVKCKH